MCGRASHHFLQGTACWCYPQHLKYSFRAYLASAQPLLRLLSSGQRKHRVAAMCDQMWAAENWQGPFVTVINPLSHTAHGYFLYHCCFYFFTNKNCRIVFAPAHIRLETGLWQAELPQTCPGTGWKPHPRLAAFRNFECMLVLEY